MELRELTTKEEMLGNFELLTEVYPQLTLEEYSFELDTMLPHNYGQVGVFEGDTCIGMTYASVIHSHIGFKLTRIIF